MTETTTARAIFEFSGAQGDEPESNTKRPEDTYSDTQLAEMLMSANPQLSVAEIDALLHEPRKLLSRFNRRDLQQIEREVWETVPGYPVTCDQTRQSIIEAVGDPKSIQQIQLVVLIRAVESFSGFVTSGAMIDAATWSGL